VAKKLLDGQGAAVVTDEHMKSTLIRSLLARASKAGKLVKAPAIRA
jgi:hypothetical protein